MSFDLINRVFGLWFFLCFFLSYVLETAWLVAGTHKQQCGLIDLFDWPLDELTLDDLEPLVTLFIALAATIVAGIVTLTTKHTTTHRHSSTYFALHYPKSGRGDHQQQAAANDAAAAADNGVSNGNASGHSTGANGNMVKTFQAYLPPANRTYSCVHCRAHLASHDELISKSFQGSQGRAYLFNSV